MPKGKGYKDSGNLLAERNAKGGGSAGSYPDFPTTKPSHDPGLHSSSGTGDFSRTDPRFPISIDKQGHGKG